MPTIEPANTQQIIQMSPLVEKVQQSTQQQPSSLAHQLIQEDNAKQNELKRTEVQDPDRKEPSDPTNPDGRAGHGRLRTNRKAKEPKSNEIAAKELSLIVNRDQGDKIDVVV